jgi:uncharacterized protein YkwD
LDFINQVNLIVLAIALIMAYVGGQRGLIPSIYDLLLDVLGLFFAFEGYSQVGAFLLTQFRISPAIANGYGFLLVVLTCELVWLQIRVVYSESYFHPFYDTGRNELLNNLGGGLFGGLRTILIVICLLVGIYSFPEGAAWRDTVARATGTAVIMNATNYLPLNIAMPIDIHPVPTVVSLTPIPFGAEPLPTSAGSPGRPDAVSDTHLLDMTNLARRQQGLAPLVDDPRLDQLAREHTTEMAKLALLFHDSPTNGSITDRLRVAGIPFRLSAENVAFSRSLEGAFSALMLSPEHSRNILSVDLHRIGVSVVGTDPDGFLLTQDFTD